MVTRTKGLLAPCYKCEEREIGCHGHCEKYLEFTSEVKRRTKKDIEASQGFIDWKRRKGR